MQISPKSVPWYRQPLVWMLIAIPLSAVLGGISMIYLAVTTDDGLVKDDYYKYGKQINLVLERDIKAKQLGLNGQLMLNPETGTILVTLNSNANELPATVSLAMLHATRSGNDKDIELVSTPGKGYHGLVTNLVPGKWYLHLGTPEWRLSAELQHPGQTSVEFTPR